jgi:predicted Zn-dependent protease
MPMKNKHLKRIITSLVLGICSASFYTSKALAADNGEEQAGRAAAAQIIGAAPLHVSADVQHYVNLLGNSLARASGMQYRWHFAVISSDAVNAFAAPGGYVLLTSGLLKLLDSEHELAYVLSHEIAHVARKHHYTVIRRQQLADKTMQELQEGEQDKDVRNVTRMSAQIYARGLDRNAEFEADRLGVEIMTRTGYDPVASIDVLSRLVALQGNDARAQLLFSTHPSPGERLDQLIAAGVEQLPRPPAPKPAMDKRFETFRSQL